MPTVLDCEVKKSWWISKENGFSIFASAPSIDFSFNIPFKDKPKIEDFINFSINFGSFGLDSKYLDFGLSPGFKVGRKIEFSIGSFDFEGANFLSDFTNWIKNKFVV